MNAVRKGIMAGGKEWLTIKLTSSREGGPITTNG
jgi:hypothetical protein